MICNFPLPHISFFPSFSFSFHFTNSDFEGGENKKKKDSTFKRIKIYRVYTWVIKDEVEIQLGA